MSVRLDVVEAGSGLTPNPGISSQGMNSSVLSVDYQRILQELADRARLGQGLLTCQEMAVVGMDVGPARVEALRSKAERLVARGWLTEPTPGQFTLAPGLAGPGDGS